MNKFVRSFGEVVSSYYLDIVTILDFYFQPVYLMMLLSSTLIAWRFFLQDAFAITIIVILYVISMYTIGYKKAMWENSKKESIYAWIFSCINIILFIVGCIINWVLMTILLIAPVVIAFGGHIIADSLICTTLGGNKLENITHSNPILFFLITMGFPLAIFITAIGLSPISILIKIIIVLVYLVLMPFIALLEDEGIHLGKIIFERF